MFKAGKYVVYGNVGVCQIRQVSPLKFGQKGLYYTLHVVHDPRDNVIYTPVSSVETGKVMIREMISREEAQKLLSHLPAEPLEWIPDLRKRNDAYSQLVSSGKTSEWARVIACLFQKQKEKMEEQRSLPRRDRELLNLAEKLFYNETAVVLGEEPGSIQKKFLALLESEVLPSPAAKKE